MLARVSSVWSPYRGLLGSGPFRVLLLGYAISALGDGAGYVAVAWLATELARPADRPYAVGLSLAAYLLPGAAVGLLAGRLVRGLDVRRLVAADSLLRLLAIAAAAALQLAGLLTLPVFVLLLAISSLLHTFGSGGVVGLVGLHVDAEHRFAANSALEAGDTLALTVAGPALGGILVVLLGTPAVLLIDAATFLLLLLAVSRLPARAAVPAGAQGATTHLGLRALLARPAIAWLLLLTLVFYGLYGPVETALPILVRHDLHQGPAMLGLIWAAFGAGALVGGLLAGARQQRNLRRFAVATVCAWGLALLAVAATDVPAVILVAIAAGGFVYAPYPAAATTLLQHELSGDELTAGAVAWNAVDAGVVPLGMALGGPLVAALGARSTLGGSALATIALAAVALLTMRRRR